MKRILTLFVGVLLMTACNAPKADSASYVTMKTNYGTIVIELYPDKAPVTVENFVSYVQSGFYNGTIFHRIIDGFMIQGGGLTADMSEKATNAPIKNEAANGLKNSRGTIAMARTSIPDSATSQFFINTVDNTFLDYRDNSMQGIGYAVFGKVTEGMDVVDAISKVSTQSDGMMSDIPVKPVIITEVTVSFSEKK